MKRLLFRLIFVSAFSVSAQSNYYRVTNEEFYRLYDYHFRAELEVLKLHYCENRCVVVNLNNFQELKSIIDKITIIA